MKVEMSSVNPIRRLARVLVVSLATLSAVAMTPAAAHAATSNVGTVNAYVDCYPQSHSLSVTASAVENTNWSSQYVVVRAAYTSGGYTYTSGWTSPRLVDATHPAGYLSGPFTIDMTTTSAVALPSINASGLRGWNTVWVQAGFWNGRAYEYTGWVAAYVYDMWLTAPIGSTVSPSVQPCYSG